MKIQPFDPPIHLAGTKECPSTQRRNRCPKCYALIPSYCWKGYEGQCPVCKLPLRTIPIRPMFWGYFLMMRSQKSIIWQLFYVLVWVPIMLFDHYFKLRNLGYYAMIKVIT